MSKPLTKRFISTLSLGWEIHAAFWLLPSNSQLLLPFGRPLLWLFDINCCNNSDDIFSLGSLFVRLLVLWSFKEEFGRFMLDVRSTLWLWDVFEVLVLLLLPLDVHDLCKSEKKRETWVTSTKNRDNMIEIEHKEVDLRFER